MQKYYMLFVLVLITSHGIAQAPDWNWAINSDSLYGYAAATDNSGNLYVTGWGGNHYLNKYDASGNLLWEKIAGGPSGCDASEICTDNAGNIYLTGSYSSTAMYPTYFDTIALVSVFNSRDLFVAKLDSSGNVKWAKSAGGSSDDYWGTGISTDGAGNVYVSGGVGSLNYIFGNDTLQGTTSSPCFSLLKYDANGNEQWGKMIGVNGIGSGGFMYNHAEGICTDVNGNFYITGNFYTNPIDFGGITLTNTTTGYPDYFFAKFDSAGNVIWAKGSSGQFAKWGKDVSMDNSGYLYTIGKMDGDSDFDTVSLTWPGRCFIVKYDTSGNVIWAKNFGDIFPDRTEDVSVDNNGNIFISGEFYDQAFSFGNCILYNADPSEVSSDIYVVKFDSLGNELWAQGAGSDTSDEAYGITVGANGNAYVTGVFHALQMFFDGMTVNNTGPCITWCDNPFIARLDHCSSYYTLYADTVPHNWIAVNHASGIAPITYLWDWGDGNFSSGATPSHTYNTPGFYNICLTITDAAGCTNTYCDSSTYLYKNSANTMITVNVVSQTTGQAEIIGENILNIFPNPTSGSIQLTLPVRQAGISTKHNAPLYCEIVNMMGKRVYASPAPLIPKGESARMEMDVSFLAKGIYLVRVGDGERWENKKLVIE